ncbi:hypothetical protein RGU70_07175 [Herbaspirillum sp. RTI4]|nr:hypothetical protein [Herbaspirillum sp. RTI4]MDY7578099.1 hypothetical protein [Herbaspirillum sp. RTI4]MEA9980688.1 hypothetical protein [Herbaspirillum sp. RTI4]
MDQEKREKGGGSFTPHPENRQANFRRYATAWGVLSIKTTNYFDLL